MDPTYSDSTKLGEKINEDRPFPMKFKKDGRFRGGKSSRRTGVFLTSVGWEQTDWRPA